MDRPENPAAFPFVAYSKRAGSESIYSDVTKGMSLRDWFAGQALAMLPHVGETALSPAEWAHDAYAIADALLSEREKRP